MEFIDFPSKAPNSRGLKCDDTNLRFTGKELIHAILTCGVINPLCEADSEFKYKKYAIECQLDDDNGKLYLSKAYDDFDPSEKRCLSYYRGMIFSRLIAYKRFDSTHFVHLRTCENRIHMATTRKASFAMDPDIIAWNENERSTSYSVWECKGYKKGLSGGKKQAEKIEKIDGNDVRAQIVSAIYQKGNKNEIFASVKDPKEKGRDVSLDFDKALKVYYSPVVNFINNAPLLKSNNKMQLRTIEIDSDEYEIGVPENIYECISGVGSNKKDLQSIIKEYFGEKFVENEDMIRDENIFNDYIYIK